MGTDKSIINPELLRKEVDRYKSLYEHEKEQFEEFQRFSKDLETELETELAEITRKMKEYESQNNRISNELFTLRARYDRDRHEHLTNENNLKARLHSFEELSRELKEKLRIVEQKNDDLERRDRIQNQEIADLQNRYDQCLERCALLEAGYIKPSMIEISEEIRRRSMGVFNNSCNSVLSHSSHLNSMNSANYSDVVMSDSTATTSDGRTSGIAGSSDITGSSDIDIVTTTHPDITNSTIQTNGHINGYSNGSSQKMRSPTLFRPFRPTSSVIVGQLIRKIEEAQKHLDPRKFKLLRSPRVKDQTHSPCQ